MVLHTCKGPHVHLIPGSFFSHKSICYRIIFFLQFTAEVRKVLHVYEGDYTYGTYS